MTDIENDSVETLPTSTEVNSNRDLTPDNSKETLVAEGSCSPTSCSASEVVGKDIERFTVDEVDNSLVKEFMIKNNIEHIVETPTIRALMKTGEPYPQ